MRVFFSSLTRWQGRHCLATTLATVSLFCVSGASAQTIATVNGKAIPQTHLNFLLDSQKAQGQADTPELRDLLKEELINRAVIVQEAEKQNLAQDPEVLAQIELNRQTILVRALGRRYAKANPVTPAESRKAYDEYVAKLNAKEYRARHILVESEAIAQQLIADVRGGKKFENLAKEKSIDGGSAQNGGDLGFASSQVYVKPFADAIEALKPGQMTSTPVKSEFGYHVIRLEEVRDAQPVPFDELKTRIEESLATAKLNAYQNLLRTQATIK